MLKIVENLAFVFITFFIIMTMGCELSTPDKSPPLSMDDFADVYAHAVILSQGSDSLQARAKVDSLLTARGISFLAMEQTVMHYEQDQEQWRLFWALVVKKLEDESSAVIKSDSVNQSLQ